MSHSDPNTDFDWAQMVYNIQGMVTMEQNSVTNMIESIQSFNFSRVVEAVEVEDAPVAVVSCVVGSTEEDEDAVAGEAVSVETNSVETVNVSLGCVVDVASVDSRVDIVEGASSVVDVVSETSVSCLSVEIDA